jgi:hypothetical protein
MSVHELIEFLSGFGTSTAMFIICVLVLVVIMKKVPNWDR